MKQVLQFVFFVLFVTSLFLVMPASSWAQEPTNLEDAKQLATQSHRLILIEFFRDD